MQKSTQLSLFIFRRDLRLEDNTGLLFALNYSKEVIPVFIFTPEQVENNPLYNPRCVNFMIESLEDLQKQFKEKDAQLYIFFGKSEEIVKHLLSTHPIEAVVVNRDYTPYSQKRDLLIEKVCQKQNVEFYSFDDALLQPPEQTLTKEGKPYTIFTPYFKNASKQSVPEPKHNRKSNYFKGTIAGTKSPTFLKGMKNDSVKNEIKGGRSEGIKLLKNLKTLSDYETLRDFPIKNISSHLSPYLKFTTISPREVHAAICQSLDPDHALIRSLYWRDFFSSIAFFFPHVFKEAFRPKFNDITWSHNKKSFDLWCEGKTGFPIVDAGMRELNSTGFMHNRVRMIAASFLIKDLHIDWKLGEQYFAKTLIDYDPAVNNGNWQWVASTGCDAQPYFRIFNPWNQQKKFDPDCLYIKKWIPELENLPTDVIHNWSKEKDFHTDLAYPAPIVSHEKEAKKTLELYKI